MLSSLEKNGYSALNNLIDHQKIPSRIQPLFLADNVAIERWNQLRNLPLNDECLLQESTSKDARFGPQTRSSIHLNNNKFQPLKRNVEAPWWSYHGFFKFAFTSSLLPNCFNIWSLFFSHIYSAFFLCCRFVSGQGLNREADFFVEATMEARIEDSHRLFFFFFFLLWNCKIL